MSNGDLTVKGKEVPPVVISATAENPPARATTTIEENLHSASQRHVNVIWERTQQFVALVVVIATMISGLWVTYQGNDQPIPTILSVAFGTVVGFYFGRTNHQYVGGVQLGR